MEAAMAAAPGASKNLRPFPWLNLFLFFSYFVARSSAIQTLSSDLSDRLLRREIQGIFTFLVPVALKMVKDKTWEAFIADNLLYAKGFLFSFTLVIDYHLALCYVLAIFIITQQPPYEGLGDCCQLTPLQLESSLTEKSTSWFWQVEFKASCSSTYVRNSGIFPDLSLFHSNKNISFGIVDIGNFPNAAEKFGVSLPGHLPAYILFDSAVEVARLPEFNYVGISAPKITKKLLCQQFELDRRLIEYISE